MYKYYRKITENNWYYALSIILLILESISIIIVFYLQKEIIDKVFFGKDYSIFLEIIINMIFLYILITTLFTLSAITMTKNTTYYLNNITKILGKHLFTLSIKDYKSKRLGEYLHLFSNEINVVAALYTWTIPKLIQEIVIVILISIILINTSFKFFLILLLVNILNIIVVKILARKLKKASLISNRRKSKILVRLEEAISSSVEVILLNLKTWEKKDFDKLYSKYFHIAFIEEKIRTRWIARTDFIYWISISVVLLFGFQSMENRTLTFGTFILIFQLSINYITRISNTYNLISDCLTQYASLAFLHNELSRKENNIARVCSLQNYDLKLTKVTAGYENNKISLENINMNIPYGSNIMIVGHSGSGKSSILKLLIGYDIIQSGNVTVGSYDIEEIKSKELYDTISIVSPNSFLFSDSLKNNITLGKKVNDKTIEEILKIVDLSSKIRSFKNGYHSEILGGNSTLSGGEKQKLLLARALFNNPPILLLDEAFSAIDNESEKRIISNIYNFRKNKTTIIVSHRLNETKNVDVVYMMREGKIVGKDNHSELIKYNKFYQDLVCHEKL